MIAVILILSCLLNLYGIDWGLPSRERTALVFPETRENGKLFKVLIEKRKGYPFELSRLPIDLYGMEGNRSVEFTPERFPRDELMQTLLRTYLFSTSHEREYAVLDAVSRMDPVRVNLNPHFFLYGGCFIYTVGIVLKVASLCGLVILTPDLSYYVEHPEAIETIYMVGRGVVVTSVLVSCFLLYLLGNRLYGREAGLFAALSFGLSPAVVGSAHVMKPHLFGVCFILLFLFCVLKVKERGSRSWYILSGISLGLATGSAVYFAILFLHLLTCHLLRSAKGGLRGYLMSCKDPNLLFALCSMLFAFILTNPYYLLSLKEVLIEVGDRAHQFSFSLSAENVTQFTFSYAWMIHGIALFLFVVSGLFFSLSRGREYWFLPLLPVLYFLVISSVVSREYPPQQSYVSILIPFSSLLAGIAAQHLWGFRKRWIRIITVGVFVVTLFHSLLYSLNFKQDTSRTSTFFRAGVWVNETVPHGSSIGLIRLFTPATTPPFDFRRYRITVYTPRDLSSGRRYLSQYFISDSRIDDFLVPHYQLIESFRPVIPISTMRFKDHFAGANRPVFVYKRMS
jgi:hypothetical protein